MDRVLQMYHDAGDALNGACSSAADIVRSTLSETAARMEAARAAGAKLRQEAEANLEKGCNVLKQYEDVALAEIKRAIVLVNDYPAASYTVLAFGSVLLLPGARRALYRLVVPWHTDEAVAKAAQQDLSRLSQTLESSSKTMQGLEAKMVMAEEELKRGQAKLKSTRGEMQHVLAAVRRNEKVAHDMTENLRRVKGVPNILQLRAEAASKLAALKQQRLALQKYIHRISSLDV